MIYIVCLTSIVVYFFCRAVKHDLESQGKTQSFSFLLIKSTLAFSRLIAPVTLFYVVLCMFFSATNETSIRSLQSYEAALRALKDILGRITLGPVISFVILLLAFGFTLLANAVDELSPYKHRVERLHSGLRKYHKWVGKITLIVTLLGSFTFFGQTTASQEIGHLKLTIKDLRQKGEQFRNNLEDEIRFQTAVQLMQNLPQACPSIRPVLAACEKLDTSQQELKKDKKVSADYEIKSPKLDSLLADYENRRAKINQVDEQPDTSARASALSDVPLTYAKIEKLDAILAAYHAPSAQQIKAAFETPLGREAGSSILKMALSERYLPGVKTLTDAFPIAAPLLSILSDSVRAKASVLIAHAADRITSAAVTDHEPIIRSAIDEAASKIASTIQQELSEVPPGVVAAAVSAAEDNGNRIRDAGAELQTLVAEKKEIFRKKSKQLVEELRARKRFTKEKPVANKTSTASTADKPKTDLEKLAAALPPIPSPRDQFAQAIDRLIDAGEKQSDPLQQNQFLTKLKEIITRWPPGALSDLATLSREDFVDPALRQEFQGYALRAEQARHREYEIMRERERVRAEPIRIIP